MLSGIRKEDKNLFLLTPSPVLPGGRYSLFLQKFNQKIFTSSVRKAINKLHFSSPLIWNMAPYYSGTGFRLNHSLTVYDCVDEIVGERGRKTEVIRTLEEEALKESDLIFTTSQYLYKSRKNFNPRTFLVPNGSDFKYFQRLLMEGSKDLPDLDNFPLPRIGYSGTLDDRIDLDLIKFLAESKPSWAFIIIGISHVNIENLLDLPNIHFLGFKSPSLLPHYLSKLSLGILPYHITKATRAIHPVKAYDYLSVGLPIVSTPLPECGYFHEIIKVADSRKEFLSRMEEALRMDNPEAHRLRMRFSRDNSWDNRMEMIQNEIEE